MPTVVGVRLRFASKTLWFDPAGTTPAEGDHVIVETERGIEAGEVVQAPFEVSDAELPAALKPVRRVASEADLERMAELETKQAEALPVFRELIAARKLDMKAVAVEYLFDGDKIIFFFSAEERVDFRDLVRDLSSRFQARIDLRQIGVRDEARMVGGIGHCGQHLCCARLGGEFQPVSIRMAKEQDLPLNPLKISGSCGRLMCCLRYEFDAYKDFKSRAPKRGAMISTPAGEAKVSDMDTPRETVTLRYQDGARVTVPLASMECCKDAGCPCSVGEEAFIEVAPSAMLASLDLRAVPSATAVEMMPAITEKPSSSGDAAKADRPPKEGSSRRKRRRGRGGGGTDGQAAEKAPSTPDAPEASQPAAETSGEAPSSSSGRRRRRRRRSGGSGNGGSTPSAE